LLDKFSIEVLLYLPPFLFDSKEELELFIQSSAKESSSNIEIKFVSELSNKTQIVISLVRENLGKFDIEFYNKYQDNKLKFLFFYFQDVSVDIDDIDDDIYKRIEFKDELATNINIYNEFEFIDDLKETLTLNLKTSISDILHRTNHSKINASVLNKTKGSKFFDHNNNLRKVDNFLRREKRISLINGLGGVGKTALAIEYAVQSLENNIHDYVIWLDVQNGIDKELQTFTISYLVSNTDDGKQGKEYYDRKFNDFIEEHPNSLVIFDNYENETSLKELSEFSNKYKQLDIIITSREIIPTLDIHPIELEVFQKIDDALEMFILNSNREYLSSEKETLKELLEHLGKLPLALEITANFLSDSGMDVKTYLAEFKKESLKLFDKLDDYKPEFHLENLRATLKINNKIVKNKNSMDLLKIFALISPEPISKDIIETYLREELSISEFDIRLRLKELEKFSYIKKSNNNYSMHRLLQEAIRVEYFEEENTQQIVLLTKLSLAIFHWFADSLNEYKYGNYFSQTKLHIDFILEKWENLDINEAKMYLYTCISEYIKDLGGCKKSILNYSKKAIDLIESITIKDNDKAIIFIQYAGALSLNIKYTESIAILKDILGLSIKNEILATINNDLGCLFDNLHDTDMAISYCNKSLQILIEIYGIHHPRISTSYSNLASMYRKQKNYEIVKEYQNKSLLINKEFLGDNHPRTAHSYWWLGFFYANDIINYPQSFKNLFLAQKILLSLELSPKNINQIKEIFISIKKTRNNLTKIQSNQKISINKQIDELNKLLLEKGFKKMKLTKLK